MWKMPRKNIDSNNRKLERNKEKSYRMRCAIAIIITVKIEMLWTKTWKRKLNCLFATHNTSSINNQSTTDLKFFVYSLFVVLSATTIVSFTSTFNSRYTNNNKNPIQQKIICCHLNSANEYLYIIGCKQAPGVDCCNHSVIIIIIRITFE